MPSNYKDPLFLNLLLTSYFLFRILILKRFSIGKPVINKGCNGGKHTIYLFPGLSAVGLGPLELRFFYLKWSYYLN